MHVLIGGKRPPRSSPSTFEQDVVEKRSVPTDEFRYSRCDTPYELLPILKSMTKDCRIDILDLHDHGGPGFIRLGNGRLFASDDHIDSELLGNDLAASIAQCLTETAHVRLLGCGTGAPETQSQRGRFLLIKLARALGAHRVAFATIQTVAETDFGRHGLLKDREEHLLFSSLAAIDGPCPDDGARGEHIQEIRRRQYRPIQG